MCIKLRKLKIILKLLTQPVVKLSSKQINPKGVKMDKLEIKKQLQEIYEDLDELVFIDDVEGAYYE